MRFSEGTTPEAFFCNLRDVCGLAYRGTELGRDLLISLLRVQRLWQLNKNESSSRTLVRIFCENCVACSSTTSEKIENKVIGFTQVRNQTRNIDNRFRLVEYPLTIKYLIKGSFLTQRSYKFASPPASAVKLRL